MAQTFEFAAGRYAGPMGTPGSLDESTIEVPLWPYMSSFFAIKLDIYATVGR